MRVGKLFSTWQMVVKRILANWRLLSAAVVGVVLGSTILAGTTIYFDALRGLAFEIALRDLSPVESNVLVSAERGPTSILEYQGVSAIVTPHVDAFVAPFLRGRERGGKTSVFAVGAPGTFDDRDDLWQRDGRSYFAFMTGFEESISLLPGGRMPQDRSLSAPGEPLVIEAIIPADAAQVFDVGVGDTLVAVPSQAGRSAYATVVISGIFQRSDAQAELWQLDDEVLRAGTRINFRAVPFHISQAAFFETLGPAFGEMDSVYAWLLKVDRGGINPRNDIDLLVGLTVLQERLGSKLFSYAQQTELSSAVREFERRHFFTKAPMLVAMVLIVIVILYYIVVIAAMVVSRQKGEIVLLRSRGATSYQILAIFLLEAATMSVLAAAAGPLLAAGAVSLLGYTPAFAEMTGNARLAVHVSFGAYGLSILGGVLTFGALAIPAVQASRIGVARHRQESARPARQPAFQRYYFDVALLIVGVFLFRQLSEQGSVVATSVFGDRVVDQVLLAMPGLILVASAMVLLRLLPIVLALGSRLLSGWLPAGAVLGLWQMARNPTHYARLSLLLILTAGLGVFVGSVGGTLERSFKERVFYSTGSDIRLEGVAADVRGFTKPFEKQYEDIEGVAQVVGAYRGRAFDLSNIVGVPIKIFATDIESIQDVAWFRDDFSDKPLEDLLPRLKRTGASRGIELPLDVDGLYAMAKADRPHPNVQLIARVRDANGRHFSYSFGPLDSGEWTAMRADLRGRRLTSRNPWLIPAPPLSLVAVVVSKRDDRGSLEPGWVLIDYIRAPNGDRPGGHRLGEMVEPFDDVSSWSLLRTTAESISDTLQHSQVGSEGDSGSALFAWSGGRNRTSRGIFLGPSISPLPVLANEEYLKDSGHSLGEEFTITVGGGDLPVIPVGAVEYFPTLDTVNGKWLIADLASLDTYANVEATYGEIIVPNEVWLTLDEGIADREDLADGLKREPYASTLVYDREPRLLASQVDPLLDAGWRALLLIAFATVLVLSCLGLLLHAYVSFKDRQAQFALLTSMGLSTGQLNASMWLEQSLIVTAGLALGTWMGSRLGTTIMPFLDSTDRGSQVMPPFATAVEWTTLLVTYAGIVLVFASIIFGVIIVMKRASLQQVLRLGEM